MTADVSMLRIIFSNNISLENQAKLWPFLVLLASLNSTKTISIFSRNLSRCSFASKSINLGKCI